MASQGNQSRNQFPRPVVEAYDTWTASSSDEDLAVFIAALAAAEPRLSQGIASGDAVQVLRERFSRAGGLPAFEDAIRNAAGNARHGRRTGTTKTRLVLVAVAFLVVGLVGVVLLRSQLVDTLVRNGQYALVAKVGGPAVDPLIAALERHEEESLDEFGVQNPDDGVQAKIVDALVNIGEPAVDPLVAALSDENYFGLSAEAEALGRIKDQRAVEPLVGLYLGYYADSDINEAARRSLVRIAGEERLAELVMAALDDNDPAVRAGAASALGEDKKRDAVDGLIEALSDEDAGVRYEAATALGKIADKRAIGALTRVAAEDKDPGVIEAAQEALVQTQGYFERGGKILVPLDEMLD